MTRAVTVSAALVHALLIAVIATAGAPAARADPVDDYVARQMETQHVPGLSLAVIDHGRTVKLKSYGKASLELSAPMTPDSVIEIGSLTKSFTAAAIMLLVQDHKVTLDDHIDRYIKEAPPAWHDITIRELLNHTSGLAADGIATDAKTELADFSEAEFLASATALPLQAPPGTAFAYSNLGYDLLSIIVSRVSGQSYRDFLQARIFGPAGMSATRVADRTAITPNKAQGYLWARGALHLCLPRSSTRFRGSGSLQSTVRDLVRWDAVLSGNTLLTADSRKQMWTSGALSDGTTTGYGFGWEVSQVNGHRLITHNGAMNGFLSSIQRYPDDHLTVIVALNQSDLAESGRIATGVARLYLPALRPPRLGEAPAVARPDRATLAAAAGYYEYWGNYMLALVPTTRGFSARLGGGSPVEYRATIDGRFWNEEDATSLMPVKDGSGKVIGMTVIGADGNRRVIPRLAPDFTGAAPIDDPQPKRTATIKEGLVAMENGVTMVRGSAAIAPGPKRDFSSSEDFGGIRSLQLLHDEDVQGRGISRHGEAVADVLAYRVKGELHDSDVLVFLTGSGQIADFDLSAE
jgi:CubicO group peptidase (beta-lactamase class C family)